MAALRLLLLLLLLLLKVFLLPLSLAEMLALEAGGRRPENQIMQTLYFICFVFVLFHTSAKNVAAVATVVYGALVADADAAVAAATEAAARAAAAAAAVASAAAPPRLLC